MKMILYIILYIFSVPLSFWLLKESWTKDLDADQAAVILFCLFSIIPIVGFLFSLIIYVGEYLLNPFSSSKIVFKKKRKL